ncbi:hypothetical protein SLS60_001802 [Paraconiothyrium brasiliense]|uniref:F-box domain-containing protein n=1 Tax=Paraconiothyrium brasiliense TaxID=300254 RepID=A0ABR3S1P4_9PLEO
MPRRNPTTADSDQSFNVADMLSRSLAAMRLAEDKERDARWRIMQEQRRAKQTVLAEQKGFEDKKTAAAEKLENSQAEYRNQKRLALETLGPFLSLPAELCNYIYSFCKEPKLLLPRSRTNDDDNKTVGEYLALTQVNKQIRAEFKPMHGEWIKGATVDP